MSNNLKSAAGKQDAKPALTPKLRFPEFRERWIETKLDDLCSSISSGRDQIDAEGTFDLYGSTSIIGKTTNPNFSGERILIARVGANAGFLTKANGQFGVTDNTLVVSPNPSANIDYIFRYLGNININRFIFGSGQPLITGSMLKNLRIIVPSASEQQKIASCLTSLDDLIAAQSQKLDALKTHKKGLMQQLFPREGETLPRLRFPEFQDAPEWVEKSFGDLCNRIMDGTHFSPKTKVGPRAYLTSKNIKDGSIDLSNLSYISEEEHAEIYKRCPVKSNDVLLTKDGANTGNCALNNLDFEFSLLSSVAVLRGNPVVLRQDFLFQSILSDRTQTLITESMSGQAITRITLAKIGGFPIPVTSIEEQQRIASCLTSLDDLIAAQSQKLEALKTHKKGLMQQLFPSHEEVEV